MASQEQPHQPPAACLICLEDLHGEESVRAWPRCGHEFHRHCSQAWLRRSNRCPLCRTTANLNDAPFFRPFDITPTRYLRRVVLGSSGRSLSTIAETPRRRSRRTAPRTQAALTPAAGPQHSADPGPAHTPAPRIVDAPALPAAPNQDSAFSRQTPTRPPRRTAPRIQAAPNSDVGSQHLTDAHSATTPISRIGNALGLAAAPSPVSASSRQPRSKQAQAATFGSSAGNPIILDSEPDEADDFRDLYGKDTSRGADGGHRSGIGPPRVHASAKSSRKKKGEKRSKGQDDISAADVLSGMMSYSDNATGSARASGSQRPRLKRSRDEMDDPEGGADSGPALKRPSRRTGPHLKPSRE